MSYPEGHALKRSFAIMAVVGLAAVNLIGLTGAIGGGAAPEFTEAENQAVFEGDTLTFNVKAEDADLDAVTILVLELPPGATYDDTDPANVSVTWTPNNLQSGDWEARFRASDGTLFTEATVVIAVGDNNGEPLFVPITNKTVAERALLRFFVAAIDADGDALAYRVAAPSGASLNAVSRLFSWVPDYDQQGAHNVTFFVTDGTTEVNRTIVITVTNVNRAPIAGPAANLSGIAYFKLEGATPITDPDNDRMTFVGLNHTGPAGFATGKPAGFNLNASTGAFNWTPTNAQVGLWTLNIRATDIPPGGAALSAIAQVMILVLENQKPSAIMGVFDGDVLLPCPQVVDVNTLVGFGAGLSADPENAGPLNFSWDFDLSNGLNYTDAWGENTSTTFGSLGNVTVGVRVRDAHGVTNVTSCAITVDDTAHLILSMVRGEVNMISANAATATLMMWNGTIVPGVDIAIQIVHDQSEEIVSEFTVTTDADGTVTFVIPRDEDLFNRPGTHSLTAIAVVSNTFLGDSEQAEAAATYNVRIL